MLLTSEGENMNIKVNLGDRSYDVVTGSGLLEKVGEIIDLKRKILVVTDSGVPCEYSKKVSSCCEDAYIVTILQGEQSKNFDNYRMLLETMLKNNFTRADAVVAVGGGVVGDISGFAASTYMRGIDFYNIPTTVLSQVDSCVGGKTAIDIDHYKNMIGTFYQPKKVIIDFDTLKTLDRRQISNGLVESLKMAATFDEKLFEVFEKEDAFDNIEKIITRSIELKRDVVEKDEKEAGLRKVLNFGHTIGHAIESCFENGEYYHGECVGVGMLAVSDSEVKQRLAKVMKKLSLPLYIAFDKEKVFNNTLHDKKYSGEKITLVKVKKIGTFETEDVTKKEIAEIINNFQGGV